MHQDVPGRSGDADEIGQRPVAERVEGVNPVFIGRVRRDLIVVEGRCSARQIDDLGEGSVFGAPFDAVAGGRAAAPQLKETREIEGWVKVSVPGAPGPLIEPKATFWKEMVW